MTAKLTRPDPGRRLRLVSAEEARARGAADAQQLLADTFPANESHTPADALYTALIEFVALAQDNRYEELNEHLKGFCEVVGPVLQRTMALEAKCAPLSPSLVQAEDKALPTPPKRLNMRESNEAYGAGCAKGGQAADEWFSNPRRGDPKYGGTLQNVMLDLAERMRNAQSEEEIKRTRGEIVGFCYRVECPADSIACASAKALKGGAQ